MWHWRERSTVAVDAAKFALDVTALSGAQVTWSLSRESESVRRRSSFNNKSITACTPGHSCLSFIPTKADHYTPPASSRSGAPFTPVSRLLKLLHFCQSSLSEPLSDFHCFIIWSICGWVTNPRRISEPIYLLTLMHRDTLLPITFLCQAMSFWQDHLPA